MKDKLNLLITGAAGFIGFHLSRYFCGEGHQVTGIDSLNDYYDPNLKRARLEQLMERPGFRFEAVDICDKPALDALFGTGNFDIVINLAAQAGVRYSIDKPYKYIDSNLIGFINVLEACRHYPVRHLIFASSSSVYGENKKIPFSTDDPTDKPVSLYAATKKANELMAYTYSHLYDIPTTGLRFFTAYGPWGRPDMAYFSFTRNIMEGKPIKLFNHGKMRRDFTYIDDMVRSINGLITHLGANDYKWPASGDSFRVFNIGNHAPVELLEFVNILEDLIGRKAIVELYPMQDGDVPETYADIEPLKQLLGFSPDTSVRKGLGEFVKWYKTFYEVKVNGA
jgi:UDP-glucuronate 4-epimerase